MNCLFTILCSLLTIRLAKVGEAMISLHHYRFSSNSRIKSVVLLICTLTICAAYPSSQHSEAASIQRQGAKDRHAKDPLIESVKRGDATKVNTLLKSGISPNRVDNIKRTPLMYAAGLGQIEIMRALLAKGADINTRDRNGDTALALAAYVSITKDITLLKAVTLLVDNGADINLKNHRGYTALIWASLSGNTDTATVLLSAGADPNAKAEGGSTPIMFAAMRGHTSVVQVLISKGAEINTQNDYGITPLMRAAGEGQTDTVKRLLENAADPKIKDKRGRTALLYARAHKHLDVARLLEEAGEK